MNLLRYLGLVYLGINLLNVAFGATLLSLVDARPTGGTATGAFVNNELPSFLLAPIGVTFGIHNTSSTVGSQWEFVAGSDGKATLRSSPTLALADISSFRTASTVIDPAGISYSADRFNPTEVRYLFARVGTTYHAFEVAKWSNNNQASSAGDRLRFYGTREMLLSTSPGTLTVIPETGGAALGLLGSLLFLVRRRS